MYRLGGDMELTVQQLLAPPKRDSLECYTLNHSHIWTDIGRSAISIALEDIVNKGGEKVAYLPSFVCDAVKQPFIEKGFKIRFYRMGKSLNQPSELPLDLTNKVFLYVHYFGKFNQEIVHWLEEKKKHQQFFTIEDRAQAAFSSFPIQADYTIYSFRKFTPQPDGALLILKQTLNKKIDLLPENDDFLVKQVRGKLMRAQTDDAAWFLADLKNSEADLDNHMSPRKMSNLSTYIMRTLDIEHIKSIRVSNWVALENEIKKEVIFKNYITPVFNVLLKGEIPLGYPILIRQGYRDELRTSLMENSIFCPVHWPISEIVCSDDEMLVDNILTLPIDQRMGIGEIQYLIDSIKSFFEGKDLK